MSTKVIATGAMWTLAIAIGGVFGLSVTSVTFWPLSFITGLFGLVLVGLFIAWWGDFERDFG